MDAMDKLYYALCALRSEKQSLDPEYLNDVQDLSKEMMEGLSKTLANIFTTSTRRSHANRY
jgi:hypothetical protein